MNMNLNDNISFSPVMFFLSEWICSPVLLFLVQRRRWSVRYVRGHVGGGVSSSLSALTGARCWTGTNGLDTNQTDK